MRLVMRLTGVIALVTLCGAPALSQVRPPVDFSGTWVLERADGDLPERAVKALTKGMHEPITLTIEQTPAELRISHESEKGTVTRTFALDGSETTQQTPPGEMTSRTVWQGSTLVSAGKRPLPGPFPIGTRMVEFTEARSLSEHGTRLTIDVRFKTPRGVKTRTAILRRVG